MATVDFPASPNTNDTYTANGRTWRYNGTGWVVVADSSVAPLASPAFTGNPTAPTPAAGDNDTSVATTEFVQSALPRHAFKNLLANGDFQVWQRDYISTNTSLGIWTADMWSTQGINGSGRAVTYSREVFTPGQTSVPGEPRYFFRWNETNGGSGYTAKNMYCGIEGIHHVSGKPVTLSFWAKASSNITLPLINMSRWLDNPGGTYAAATNFATNVAVTTSWQKFAYTATPSSLAGETVGGGGWLPVTYLAIHMPISGTFTFDIARIQLEIGPAATEFELRPYEFDLEWCRRYYEHAHNDVPHSENGWQTYDWNSADGAPVPSDANANLSYFYAIFKVRKAYPPGMAIYNSQGVANRLSWECAGNTNSGTAQVTIPSAGVHETGARWGAGSAEGVIQGAFVYGNWEADAGL